MDSVARANEILADLVEYTGKPRELVAQRCKTAAIELAWQWYFKKSVLDFYRETDLYVFDLTKYQSFIVPDVDTMLELVRQHGMKKILDYGGGIGEYTIRLMKEAGATVTYLDLENSKTMDYARWRFQKHRVKPQVVSETYGWQNEDWDTVFAMDVLEHLENPKPVIEAMRKRTRFVFANPEKLHYNAIFPQHISQYRLEDFGFEKVGVNLYRNIDKTKAK